MEQFMKINTAVNGFVWGPFGLALLFCTGFWMSARTGFFQFRKMGYWLRHTIGAIFTNKDVTAHTSKEDMAISQFQSMCTALAGTIGTGNIVGVATAIVSGGPGAIFWMWVMALLGMMTSYAENVLGIYYRRKDPAGTAFRRRIIVASGSSRIPIITASIRFGQMPHPNKIQTAHGRFL